MQWEVAVEKERQTCKTLQILQKFGTSTRPSAQLHNQLSALVLCAHGFDPSQVQSIHAQTSRSSVKLASPSTRSRGRRTKPKKGSKEYKIPAIIRRAQTNINKPMREYLSVSKQEQDEIDAENRPPPTHMEIQQSPYLRTRSQTPTEKPLCAGEWQIVDEENTGRYVKTRAVAKSAYCDLIFPNGVHMHSVLDGGSEVTMISEQFYERNLKNSSEIKDIYPEAQCFFNVRTVSGEGYQCVKYLELDLEFLGMKVKNKNQSTWNRGTKSDPPGIQANIRNA